MKKVILLISIILTVFAFSNTAYGEEVELSLKINGDYIKFEQKNILKNDKLYVLARGICQVSGAKIEWINETKEIKINNEETSIEMQVGNKQVMVNGEKIELDVAPFIKNNKSYIPLRFVAGKLGFEVEWNIDNYTVILNQDDFKVEENFICKDHYTDEDLYLLAKIVDVEGQGGSLELKLSVANVILNRVKNTSFPNTIKDVIYQVDVYKQFPPAHKESFSTRKAERSSLIAAKKALEGINPIENSLFFNSKPFKSKSQDLHKVIDNEYFYK